MDKAEKLLAKEQDYLWQDLNNDLRMAINGYWSMAADSRVYRIVQIAKLVGVTPPGSIQVPLLKWGIYKAVCDRLDVTYEQEDLKMYEQYWGDSRIAGAIPEIAKMDLEDLEEENE